jgi:hypothetical protein
MIDAFHQYCLGSPRKCGEQSVVPYPELVVVGPYQPREVVLRIRGGSFHALDDPTGDRELEALYIANGSIRPGNGPARQRPSRFFTRSWSVTRPA